MQAQVKDLRSPQGGGPLQGQGEREKIHFVPAHAQAQRLVENYLLMAAHSNNKDGPLFRPVRNNRTGELEPSLNANCIETSSERTDRRGA